MASVIRISYHKRLFLMLLAFSLMIILCSIGFQYLREKQYKSDILDVQLQRYNKNLIDVIEDGIPIGNYIASHKLPFDDLRVSVIELSGIVVFDNEISLDSLDTVWADDDSLSVGRCSDSTSTVEDEEDVSSVIASWHLYL